MSLTVVMPQLGLTMTEGTVSEWLKKPGDSIRKDEMIFVVSTDKADMEVESMLDGTLREILVDKGQTVPVGTVLAYVDPPGSAEKASLGDAPTLESPISQVHEPQPEREAAKRFASGASMADQVDRSRVFASPRARRLAKQVGTDIASVDGSGPGGRIIEEDVINSASSKQAAGLTDSYAKRRQLIAERMVESVTTIPAFSVSLEINAEQFVRLYEDLREPVDQRTGAKLTYTDLLLKTVAIALTKSPEVNSTWKDGAVHRQTGTDVALAISTERGIVAPVIRNVSDVSLEQLVKRRAELAEKARQSHLSLSELEGGSGTLSNLGMYRVDRFQGIITPGQSFILGVGKLRHRPWVDTVLVIKPTIIFTLSVDHRVVDGAVAATFLERIAEVVENPYRILWKPDTNA